MIQIENVSFGYSNENGALHNINLTISKGECILLCGESGCGKTTITKLVNGLIPHFTDKCVLSGKVTVNNVNVAETELYQLAITTGSVFQNPKSQFFNLDTDSELAFGLENEGVAPELIEKNVKAAVSSLKIENLLGRSIFSLSGGEKQILAFGSVLAMNTEILVLDEPTANLDTEGIIKLQDQIRKLKETGHTVIIAEHRLYFLEGLIDRAVFIKNGEIIKIYSGRDFFALSDDERIEMGLRTLKPEFLSLPFAEKTIIGKGLEVENLACRYKHDSYIIENLSFRIDYGEVLAITGCNGTGKTTLIRCLCGLMKEKKGKIYLDGQVVKLRKRRKQSFCVMQDVNHQLFSDSVYGECEQTGKDKKEEIDRLLEDFDLLDMKERHPMSLSGGQKQRLAIVTAILSEKRILVFDEPTSGLDYRHMCEVSAVIKKLAKAGHIVIVVSHDNEFIMSCCDKVLRICKKEVNTL